MGGGELNQKENFKKKTNTLKFPSLKTELVLLLFKWISVNFNLLWCLYFTAYNWKCDITLLCRINIYDIEKIISLWRHNEKLRYRLEYIFFKIILKEYLVKKIKILIWHVDVFRSCYYAIQWFIRCCPDPRGAYSQRHYHCFTI